MKYRLCLKWVFLGYKKEHAVEGARDASYGVIKAVVACARFVITVGGLHEHRLPPRREL